MFREVAGICFGPMCVPFVVGVCVQNPVSSPFLKFASLRDFWAPSPRWTIAVVRDIYRLRGMPCPVYSLVGAGRKT